MLIFTFSALGFVLLQNRHGCIHSRELVSAIYNMAHIELHIQTLFKQAHIMFAIYCGMCDTRWPWNSPGQHTCPSPSRISHTNRTIKWVISHAWTSQMDHPMNDSGTNTIYPGATQLSLGAHIKRNTY